MTNQEILNKAVKGLASQGFERSMWPDGKPGCAYHGDKGRKCAVGWLIPDEKYEARIEGRGVYDVRLLLGLSEFNDDQVPFLEQLQLAHDRAPLPETMKMYLSAVCARYELTVPEELK